MFRVKKVSFFFAIFVFSSLCWSETIYLTFAKKDPAQNLSKENVSLRISDKAISLTEFFQVDTQKRSPEILSHPAGRRHYFIVVDLLYLNATQALEVRKLVQEFVAQVPKEDLIALGAINNEDGLRFYSGLTADRTKLISGWNAMGKIAISGMMEGPEGNLYSSKFSSDIVPTQLLPDQEFVTNLKTFAVSEKAKEEFAPLYVQSFVDLVSLFSTVPGRKHLILFSAGTDVKGLRVNLKEMSEKEPETKESDNERQRREEPEAKTLREIIQQAQRTRESMVKEGPQAKRSRDSDANVVSRLLDGTGGDVHVFHPEGVENNFLKDLAQKTKGSYKKLQEFGSAMGQILSLDQTFYVLGWQGTLQKSFHELQTLDLKAGDVGLDVSPSWLPPKPLSDYTVLEKKMHLSQVVYKNFLPSDRYRFWSDIVRDDGFNRVSSFTQIPGKSLLDQKGPKLDLSFYGYAIQDDGTVLDFYTTPITLDLTNQKLIERLQKTGLKVWNVLLTRNESITVRTIVFNNLSSEAITHSVRLRIDHSELFLSNPFFPSSNFDWIFWPAPDQIQNRRGKEIIYPYKVGADIFTPELTPSVQSSEKGKVIYFKLYNFTPGEKYPAVRLRFISENGNFTEIEKFGLLQQPRLVHGGGLEVFWTIETIPSLAKGTYRFQVDVTDKGQGKAVIRDVLTAVE